MAEKENGGTPKMIIFDEAGQFPSHNLFREMKISLGDLGFDPYKYEKKKYERRKLK